MIVVQLIEIQFLAHSLQIHYIELFGPLSFSLLGLELKRAPTYMIIVSIKKKIIIVVREWK